MEWERNYAEGGPRCRRVGLSSPAAETETGLDALRASTGGLPAWSQIGRKSATFSDETLLPRLCGRAATHPVRELLTIPAA